MACHQLDYQLVARSVGSYKLFRGLSIHTFLELIEHEFQYFPVSKEK